MDTDRKTLHQPLKEDQTVKDPYQVPITPRDQTLALTYEMGDPLEKYMSGPPRGSVALRWLLFLVFFLIGVAMTVGAIEVWLDPELYGQNVSAGGNTFVFLIGLIVLMISLPYSPLWPHIATTYLICPDGFLRVRPLAFKGHPLAIHWKQISEYYTDGYRLKLTVQDEIDSGQNGSVLITLVGNSSGSRRTSGMSNSITDRIAERIRPQAVQRFLQGEPLTFGPFTVSHDGIQYKEQSFSWEEVGGCTLLVKPYRLTFVLRARNGRQLAKQNCLQIPNVYELAGVISSELEMRKIE
jgi:hypothetical protein